MLAAVMPINTSIVSHNHHFLSAKRTFKSYSLSNFQVYRTVSLTVTTMLYSRSPEFIYLITGSGGGEGRCWTKMLLLLSNSVF